MDPNVALGDLPVWVWAAIGLLGLVQVAVEITALVVLVRTPVERLVLGKKWPWVLLILFVNLVGAIVFLAAGRKPAPAVDSMAMQVPPAGAGQTGADLADTLYGSGSSPGTGPQEGDRR